MSALRIMALFGQEPARSERDRLLKLVLQEKASRSWITEGSYAWWRYCDYVQAAQRRLLTYRYPPKGIATTPADASEGGEAVRTTQKGNDPNPPKFPTRRGE